MDHDGCLLLFLLYLDIFGHISTHCMGMRSQTLGHGEECVGGMMELQELSRWI